MTNEQYWSLLDKAASRKGDERMIEFAKLLMDGYEKEYEILEISKDVTLGGDYSSHLFVGDSEHKLLMCCTTIPRAKKVLKSLVDSGKLPEGGSYSCVGESCKSLLDKLYYRKDINGLVFNPMLPNEITIPADIFLRPYIAELGKAVPPEGYEE